MAHRPFTRRQALQNQAWLDALRATGNPRLAASLLGVHRSTYLKRRAKSAAFAQDWDAQLAAAHAAFHLAGGPRPPEQGTVARHCPSSHRTKGGELHVARTRGGRLQLRRAPAGWMTRKAEQAFFFALSATANVRLSAAAAGFSHSAFYARKRQRPYFAREMRISLTIGCDRVDWALTQRAFQALGDPDWRAHAAGDSNPLPPMTIDQCIHLVTLHQNRDRLRATIDRGQGAASAAPLDQTDEARARAPAPAAARRARHYEATGDWRLPEEPLPPELPPLHLVTGWSKAEPDRAKAVHNPKLALFGGWRLKDWKKRKAGKG